MPTFMWVMVVLTALMLGASIYNILTSKNVNEQQPDKRKENVNDEVKTIWQRFGLIDETPNLYRAVVRGNEDKGPIVTYIAPGEKYNHTTHRMVKITPEEQKEREGIFYTLFGKIWYGFPFINSLRPLPIDRVVKKSTEELGKGAKLEDQLKAMTVIRYGLQKFLLRPTHHKDLDTTDGVRFSITSYAQIEVFDPEPAFTIYKENFLQTIIELVSGLFSLKVLPYEWEYYKKTGKDIEQNEIDKLNVRLESIGVKIIQLIMSDPEVHPDMQAAFEEHKKAIEAAKAKGAKGKGKKDYLVYIAEGEASAIERIAEAKKKRFEVLISMYTTNGFTPYEAAQKASEMISAEFNAEAIGKLTNYVAGSGGINLNIPAGEKKPAPARPGETK